MAPGAHREPLTAEQAVHAELLRALPAKEYAVHANVDWLAHGEAPPGRAEGEGDLVVCHPERGVLVLEVKGGGVACDLGRKAWWSIDRTGQRRAIQDPMRQAAATARHLLEVARRDAVLAHDGGFPLPVGHGVVTPHTTWRPSDLPLHWPRELVLDADALRDLGGAVTRAFDYWAGRFPPRRRLEPPQWRHLNARLSPKVTRAACLSALIADEERRLVELTNQQIAAMQMFRLFPRLKISGCAGSGKTLLAVAEARRLAAEGRRVLLLVYNRLLAEFLGRVLADAPGVTATGFHAFCHQICAVAGVTPPTPPAGDDARTYWVERFPDFAFEQLDRFPDRFDAVIVDEGQDFRANWWAMVELLLHPEGRLVVFYDPNQDIFGAGAAIPIDAPPALLTRNCRSTAALNRAACAVGQVPFPSEGSDVEGEPPEVVAYRHADEVPAQLRERVRRLVHSERVARSAVVVLSPRRLEKSCLAGAAQQAGLTLVADREPASAEELRYATLQSFKGLEADVVLLVDVDLEHKTSAPANLYVAFSRARHRLVVWAKEAQAAQLAAMIGR